MRREARASIAASLGLCLVCGTAAGWDKDTYQSGRDSAPKKPSMWESLWPFGGSKKKDEPAKPDAKAEKAKAEAKKAKPSTPAPLRTRAEEGSQAALEQNKVLRRQQVCDRLRQIASDSNDSSLDAQAQLMEQRAWFIYEQRTSGARLPGVLPKDERVTANKLMQTPPTTAKTDGERPLRSVMVHTPGKKTAEED